MDVRYHLSVLRARASRRHDGRAAHFLARGRIDGEFVYLDETAHHDVLRRLPQRLPYRYKLANLQAPDGLRPDGFAGYVLSRGRREGDEVVLDDASHRELRELFYPAPKQFAAPSEPSFIELSGNFAAAMAGWINAGFKIVDRDEYERRAQTCRSCDYWDAFARMGAGRCARCGCSGLKLWLASSACPDTPPRW